MSTFISKSQSKKGLEDIDGFLPNSAAKRALDKGLLLRFKKEIPQAIEVLEKAREQFHQQGVAIGEAFALIELAWLYGTSEEWARSEKYFREAEEIIGVHPGMHGMHEVLSRWLHYKGLLLYQKDDFGPALKMFKEALTFCDPQGLEAAKIYDSLGVHYERTGDFHRAVRYLKSALTIKTTLKNPQHEEAITCQILGRLYLLYEDYELAYGHLSRSLELTSELKDEKRKASLKNELIRLFLRFGKDKEAHELIQSTRANTQSRHLKIQYGMTCFYESYLLFRRGQTEKAVELLNKSVLPVFSKFRYKKGMAMAKRLQAWLSYTINPEETHTPIALISEAIELFRWENMIDEIAKSHYELGKLYHDMEDPKLALASFMDSLKIAEENGLFYLMPYIEDEIFRTNENEWRDIVNKRARHERIFEKRFSLIDALSEMQQAHGDDCAHDHADLTDARGIPFLVSLLKIGQAMAAERNLERLLQLVRTETESALNAGLCVVYLYDSDTNELWSPMSNTEDMLYATRFPANQGLAGYVVKTGEILNIKNASDDPRFTPEVDTLKGIETENMLCVPIWSRKGNIIGVFQVFNKRLAVFHKSDEELLIAISSSAGIAVENAQLYQEQKMTFESFVQTLSSTIDARDPITAGHSERVMHYAMLIAEKMNLSDDELEVLKYAALLHDIGKIGVKEEILMKQGRLTENEYKHIQEHVRYTYEILQNIRFEKHLQDIPEVAASHHERMDGEGYFRGLKGENIPFGGRILALADVFDAITSRRQYRVRMPFDRVIQIMRMEAGEHFDEDVVEMFMKVGLQDLARVLCMDYRECETQEEIDAILSTISEDVTIGQFVKILEKPKQSKDEKLLVQYFDHLYRMTEISDEDDIM